LCRNCETLTNLTFGARRLDMWAACLQPRFFRAESMLCSAWIWCAKFVTVMASWDQHHKEDILRAMLLNLTTSRYYTFLVVPFHTIFFKQGKRFHEIMSMSKI
jgi:hypothetical protein